MSKSVAKPALLRMSVEEENLASIPFAVLESRVGKRISKIEIQGTKLLPDGREMRVSWQVQGNSDLGLPTEQDLDIFVALGVLTFRNEFAKTVSFTGREIAKILGISGVHGKFYQRLKLAMDRFVPLRFRAITATDRQEEVKWVNVFQEASFTLDRDTGRCTGTVTWTDKLIQSMNSGFFRVLDAGRYMELDGITGKHLYRFLAVAFEKTDIVVVDARKLVSEHLGIVNVPKYFSRLMQTLEPAFEQLIRIEVLGSFHVTDSDAWELALQRHRNYVPERKALLQPRQNSTAGALKTSTLATLETIGFEIPAIERLSALTQDLLDCHQLARGARLLQSLVEIGVLPYVASGLIERCLLEGPGTDTCREQLDWFELALDTCQQKLRAGQRMKNPAGMVIKIARDPEARLKMVGESRAAAARKLYRQRENHFLMEYHQAEQRELVLEYEDYRSAQARTLFEELPDNLRAALRNEKAEVLRQQGRYDRIDPRTREQEMDDMICQDIARKEVPPFEKWMLRKRAAQALLPFSAEAVHASQGA